MPRPTICAQSGLSALKQPYYYQPTLLRLLKGTKMRRFTPNKKSPVSLNAFEMAFLKRLGQTPKEYIAAKIDAGSPVDSAKYLYDMICAEITKKQGLYPPEFNRYHKEIIAERMNANKKTVTRLVRDNMPEIAKAQGKEYIVEKLDHDVFQEHLDNQLQIELDEYMKNRTLSNLADIAEVIDAIVIAHGMTLDDLATARREKTARYGGFDSHLLLKEVKSI